MQMTAVYSCVRILAEAVAGLPLNLYRYTEDGGKEKAIGHPLYLLLHDEPNPEMSSFVFRETLMAHLLLWGNAYAQVIRNGKGEVVALYPLMPNKMTVDRDERGQLYYSYQRGNDEAVRSKDQTVILRPPNVLHIPGLGFDGLTGENGNREGPEVSPGAFCVSVKLLRSSFTPRCRTPGCPAPRGGCTPHRRTRPGPGRS